VARREFLMPDRIAAHHAWRHIHGQYVRCAKCGADAEILDGTYYQTYPSSRLPSCEHRLPRAAEAKAVESPPPSVECPVQSNAGHAADRGLLLEADTSGVRLRFSPDTDPLYVASVFQALLNGQQRFDRPSG